MNGNRQTHKQVDTICTRFKLNEKGHIEFEIR